MRSRRFATLAALLSALVSNGCELTRINVPVRPSRVVIHGVLSGSSPNQVVLVERTLTGEKEAVRVLDYSSAEPILTDGGVPESGAIATLTTPTGDVIPGPEWTTFSTLGNGAGVYIFALPGAALVPGGKYTLRIVTKQQEVITAETIVPEARAETATQTMDFNRATEALAMQWSAVGQSRGYQVRIDNPYTPWITFTDSLHVSLTGTLRSLASDNLAHVFLPGFRQIITVSAVDANVYDYYRTNNNAFTGAGLISRVSGGLGVFGSVITVVRRSVNVVAPPQEPIEGTFDLLFSPLGYFYGGVGDARTLTLYVESPATRQDQLDAVTAAYRRSGGSLDGAIGTWSGKQLMLAFLSNQLVKDTLDIFVGELHGDTLDGRFSKGAPAQYVRRR